MPWPVSSAVIRRSDATGARVASQLHRDRPSAVRRMRGAQDLRVIDSPWIPRVPSGSPGAAAIMVAARAAEFIREGK